jgi:hypothetical protein
MRLLQVDVAWAIAWRLALVAGVGWLWPASATVLVCPLIGVALFGAYRFAMGSKDGWNWHAATIAAIACAALLQGWSNRLADDGLVALREALQVHHERTGAYPESLDELVGVELESLPPAGLPGTQRSFSYAYWPEAHSPVAEELSPVLYYPYAMPFLRMCIDVATGRLYLHH